MKVILLQNIKNFGRAGDIKSVSDGYARNFLMPKNLAKPANENSIKEAELLRARAQAQMEVETKEASRIADSLKDSKLEFSKKVSKTGTLFASITAQELAKSISQKAGAKISPDMIDLSEFGGHIKHVGSHPVSIELAPGVRTQIQVIVASEQN
jgi:large subunit ribosomal protein L9